MTTPQTPSVELEQLAPSFDERAVESEENQVLEPAIRELSSYSFDSDDETLVGIGDSSSVDSSTFRHFDSSDQTLVGIGPLERAKLAERARLAELAELSSLLQQAEAAPPSVPAPQSEPPGPFVAGDDELLLPMQKGVPWLELTTIVLVAAAAVVVLRSGSPHKIAPRLHNAATVAPPVAHEPRTSYARFATTAALSLAAPALEIPFRPAFETPLPAASAVPAPREKPAELAPRHAGAKSGDAVPHGALDVSSSPPSSLVLDGRPLGKTPRVVELPSGPHTVVFVHPERGRMSVTVTVKAGRKTSASANF